jgi:hypothetical protein
MIQEYLSFSDLPGLDSSPDAVRNKFKDHFGERPDGIALNKETYYDAVKPPITEQYSHYCYKTLGQYQFTSDSSEPPQQAIVGSNTAVNQGDTEAEIQLAVTGAWSETTGWSTSITTGMSFSTEFSIEGVFKMGTSFSVSVTAGASGSKSVSRSSTATVSVKVPPRSQVKVDMVATMKKENMDFKAPISVSGMFGANFPDRVQGHYFWFLGSTEILPKNSGEITGTIEGAAAFDVHTNIGKAIPIES